MNRNAEFRLTLFGRPELVGNGRAVDLTPTHWALAGVVFGSGTAGLKRVRAAQLLWGAHPEDRLRRRLSQVLYELEQRAGSGLLNKPGDRLRPDRDAVVCDLEAFEAGLTEEAYGLSAGLLAEGFLAGLSEVPTPEFERWIDARQASLRADLRTAAIRRWARAESEGIWNRKTREAAEALLQLSPRSEEALRRVMWSQAMSGAALEAIATLDSFVERWALDGLESLEDETATLLQRVRALARHRKATVGARPRSTRADPTLYGREAEMAWLRPRLAGAVQEGLTIVALEGEAGMGKTRLVRECLEPAALQGRLLLTAQLAELERDIALNALMEAMSTQELAPALLPLEEPWRSVILSLMPEFAEVVGPAQPIPQVQPASLQRRLLESVRLLLNNLVGGQPLLMFLDDFHWVDDSSLAALEYIRRRWEGGSMVLVLAYRPEFVAEGSGVRAFLDAPDVEVLPLRGIDEAAQKQLLREAAAGDVPDEVVETLTALGAGNPLFLIELARQWIDGALELPVVATDPVALPASIQQLFDHRIRGMTPLAVRVLEALSMFSHPVALGPLAEVTELSNGEVADGLELVDRSGLIRWEPEGTLLWHGVVRQSVLNRTSEGRLRWLHSQMADYLLRQDEHPADELALHCDRAGRGEEAYEFGLKAADLAEEVGAIDEARMFIDICLRWSPADQRPSLTLRLAGLCHLQCDFQAAGTLYGWVVANGSLPAEATLVASARSFDCYSRLSPGASDCRERLDLLLSRAMAEENWSALSYLVLSGADYLARIDCSDEVVSLLPHLEHVPESVEGRAKCLHHQAGFLLRLFGVDTDLGRQHGNAGYESAVAEGMNDLLGRSTLAYVLNHQLDGTLETDEGRKVLAEALTQSIKSGDLHARFKLLCNLSGFYLDVGELDKAERYLDAGFKLRGAVDLGAGGVYADLNGCLVLLERDNPDEALARGTQLLPTGSDTRWYGWAIVHAILGQASLDSGKLGQARLHFETLQAEWPEKYTVLLDLGTKALFEANYLRVTGERSRALNVLHEAESILDGANLPQCLRVQERRLSQLARLGRDSAAAEAASFACERSHALGLQALARKFARHRDRLSA